MDPLCYPLLFPRGDAGWHVRMCSIRSVYSSEREEHVEQREGEQGEEGELDAEWDEQDRDLDHGQGPRVQERGARQGESTVSMREFYAHRIAQQPSYSHLLSAERLFQQYLVNAYVKIERTRLDFQRHNQQLLRADTYRGLADFVASEAHDPNVTPGRVFVLPSTFIGGPRHMDELYMDAMAICRRFGSPDLFVTFTCNPH